MIKRVAVLGLGTVGRLVERLLAESGFDVIGADADPRAVHGERDIQLDVTDATALADLLAGVDATISCLPYRHTADLATAARATGVHYLDLTEDVPTSLVVQRLAEGADSALIPHCGLAPGFICIIGGEMARGLDRIERLALRVGALPAAPNTELGYAFNWSPAGVVNEYLNRCQVLDEYEPAVVTALSDVEPLIVEGVRYEAFATSGGLGTMCDSFTGRIRRLDYKSVRYPGHCRLMRFFLHELGMGRRRTEAEELLQESYPPVEHDLVVVYAAAEGDADGRRVRRELAGVHRPRQVAGRRRTTISWTTAAGVVGVLELLAAGQLPPRGLVRQEDIPLDDFLATSAGALLALG